MSIDLHEGVKLKTSKGQIVTLKKIVQEFAFVEYPDGVRRVRKSLLQSDFHLCAMEKTDSTKLKEESPSFTSNVQNSSTEKVTAEDDETGILSGAIVKYYDTGEEHSISEIKNGKVYFVGGGCFDVGNFLRYYKFLDRKKRTIFERKCSKEISDFHTQSARTEQINRRGFHCSPTSIPDDSIYDCDDYDDYDFETDSGPDDLITNYYEWHAYD